MDNQEKLSKTFGLIDQINQSDPTLDEWNGKRTPAALLYSQRISEQLLHYYPEASAALQISARAHHIGRWQIPRTNYPPGKKGYHQWRTGLYSFHANETGKILLSLGYSELFINKVKLIIAKKNLRSDFDTQILEDVICHVFLVHYLEDFSKKHEEDKVIQILQKTWKKMTPYGQQVAKLLPLSDRVSTLLELALSPTK